MSRPGPRRIELALGDVLADAEPATLLAGVQAVWAEVAGDVMAAEAEPVSERAGTVTCSCSSAVWAQELTLLASDLTERLNARLGGSGEVAGLRFSAASRGRS